MTGLCCAGAQPAQLCASWGIACATRDDGVLAWMFGICGLACDGCQWRPGDGTSRWRSVPSVIGYLGWPVAREIAVCVVRQRVQTGIERDVIEVVHWHGHGETTCARDRSAAGRGSPNMSSSPNRKRSRALAYLVKEELILAHCCLRKFRRCTLSMQACLATPRLEQLLSIIDGTMTTTLVLHRPVSDCRPHTHFSSNNKVQL